jgi:C-terminal processing protease CtpA/Prc
LKKIATLLLLCACELSLAQTQRQLDNLETFNRLYGYVKYFHPSDEAANLDWDKFAVYGSREIEKCKTSGELQKTLLELFLPIAPTIKIVHEKQGGSFTISTVTPADTTGFKVVSWQHTGVGLGDQRGPYHSARINRKSAQSGPGFGTITTFVNAEKYRSKEFRLTASVKMLEGPCQAHLWARVDKPNQKIGFFDNMNNRPITSHEWKTYEINGTIDSDAENLTFGCFLKRTGKLQLDNLSVSIREGDVWKTVYANSFESDKSEVAPESVRFGNPPGYNATVTEEGASDGKKSLIIEGVSQEKVQGLLFDRYCKIGEHIKKNIGSGLTVIIPSAVYGTDSFTFPQADSQKLTAIKEQLQNISMDPETDLYARIGDIIITWNVFQHFYPYFKETKTDWNAAFRTAINEAYNNMSTKDFSKTLQKLTAQLKDGHVRVTSPLTNDKFALALAWEWIENELVVTNVLDKNISMAKGDIIAAIDGQPADKYFQEISQYISAATEGWLRYRTQTSALFGPENSVVMLTRLGADGKKNEVRLTRSLTVAEYHDKLKGDDETESIRKLGDDLYYINLDKASMDQIRSRFPELQNAKTLICDLRGYPNKNHELIGHLLQQNDTSKRWMRVPQIIYPDQENITGYREMGWELKPLQPHLAAKVFFIIDGRAISYAESYMGFIEHYKLATIVGQPSAGTNGNVNPFSLPGGYRISWTGMKVFKQDGSQLHGIGITPDVHVQKTIRGVIENRDEFLEKAIELANQYKLKISD